MVQTALSKDTGIMKIEWFYATLSDCQKTFDLIDFQESEKACLQWSVQGDQASVI